MVKILVAAVASLSLAACAAQSAPPSLQGDGTCDPANIQQFVGQQRSTQLEQEMRRVSHAATVRWVPQGTMITMEFSPQRLTVFLDANHRVERISCS
jgi:hypothetical protein